MRDYPTQPKAQPLTLRELPPGHSEARERLVSTAYALFSRHGVGPVGVDRIVAEAGVSKTSLYRHFRSKDELVVAVLQRHEVLWTWGWLAPQAEQRAASPALRLVVIFDLLLEWARQRGFQGCLFTNCLLETHDRSSPVRIAAARAIDDIYDLLLRFAVEADLRDPEAVAHQVHVLMRGSFVAAVEGRLEAVREARAAAERLVADHS